MQRETKTTGKLEATELSRLISDEPLPTEVIEREQLLELIDASTEKHLAHTIGRDSHRVAMRPMGAREPSALRGLVLLGAIAVIVRLLIGLVF